MNNIDNGRSHGVLKFIVTTFCGAVAWFIGLVLYVALFELVPRCVLIGVVFTVLYLFVSIFTFAFNRNVENMTVRALLILIASAAVFCLSVLLQWLYGLNPRQDFGPVSGDGDDATAYIFAVDDSSSTLRTDPSNERYRAIQAILEGKNADFPYMVYSFATNVAVLRDMAPISSGSPVLSGGQTGATGMGAAITRIMDDFEANIWKGGNRPGIVILTDGVATDIDGIGSVKDVLKKYVEAGISISVVSFGNDNNIIASQIAGTTGGNFVDVSDASMLFNAIQEVTMPAGNNSLMRRDLLFSQNYGRIDSLYVGIRIVFIAILGTVIGTFAPISYGFMDSVELAMPVSLVKAVAGAVLMEYGTEFAGFSEYALWFILWLILAGTLIRDS